MAVLLPIAGGAVRETDMVFALEELRQGERENLQAFSAMGLVDELPPVVLADDAVCLPGLGTVSPESDQHRVVAWSGNGWIDLRRVLRDWSASSSAQNSEGYLLRRLRAELPRPLPAGARVALVDLEAVLRLERSMDASSRRSPARRRVLVQLAAQRALLCALLGGVDSAGPCAAALLARVHRQLVSCHPRRARFEPSAPIGPTGRTQSARCPGESPGSAWLQPYVVRGFGSFAWIANRRSISPLSRGRCQIPNSHIF